MKWMVPFARLGDAQRRVLDACTRKNSGNHWIQGFAGSGKTVLLVHAISRLKEEHPGCSICVVTYTHALKDLVSTGINEKHADVPVMTYHAFCSDPEHYDYLLVDEVQDIKKDVLAELNEYADTLIVAGDQAQSIYLEGLSASELRSTLSPKAHVLEMVYRLSKTLREAALAIFPSSKIETAKLDKTTDVRIVLAKAESYDEEFKWVWDAAKGAAHPELPSVVLLPTKRMILRFIHNVIEEYGEKIDGWPKADRGEIDFDAVNEILSDAGAPLRYLGSSFGDLYESDDDSIVYLMTYHSAKGLDFETVFLPFLNNDAVFWKNNDDIAKRIFYVGVTRSRRDLHMSYHSAVPHSYVKSIPQRLVKKVSCNEGDSGDLF